MGHTLGELFPRGYEVEIREEREREWQRQKEKEKRYLSRLKKEREWMQISDKELSQSEVKKRLLKLFFRFDRIVSVIPVPIQLNITDGQDIWEIFGAWDGKSSGNLHFVRPRYNEDERFELSIDKQEARAKHMEKGLYDISFSRGNSERELRPAEELFDRLISPIEEKMGLPRLG